MPKKSPKALPFKYNDGGRKKAGFKGTTGDCVTRAIAIALKQPYAEVYEWVNVLCAYSFTANKRRREEEDEPSYAHNGPYLMDIMPGLNNRGWRYYVARGKEMTLDQIPRGRIVARVKNKDMEGFHLMAIVNGVIHDTFDWQTRGLVVVGFIKKFRHRPKKKSPKK
jgi:hypothetical protein